jgi:hypothetical protein
MFSGHELLNIEKAFVVEFDRLGDDFSLTYQDDGACIETSLEAARQYQKQFKHQQILHGLACSRQSGGGLPKEGRKFKGHKNRKVA